MIKKLFNYSCLFSAISMVSAGVNAAQTIEEIFVTGTKRDQKLEDVPASVSVLTAQDIQAAGIKRPKDFLSTIPNVTFIEDNAGEVYVNIRGQTAVRNSDPNVAVVIDGVPLVSLKAFNQDLFDLQSIEVLKGPQSAIYGRNAAAGAIVITTKQPGDEVEGTVSVGAGSWSSSRSSFGVSGPLTDNLKFAVSASTSDTDGPFTNVLTGEKVQRYQSSLGRVKLLYQPNDQLEVAFRLAAHDSKGGGTAYNAQFAGLPIGGVPVPRLDANQTNIPFVSNIAGFSKEKMVDAVVDINYQFESFSLRSITSVNSFDSVFGGDGVPYIADSGGPGALTQVYTYDDKTLSQEFRVTSENDSAFRWMAGVYYLSFDRSQQSELGVDVNGTLLPTNGVDTNPINPTASYTNSEYETENIAGFVSLQYDLMANLSLELAGRYDVEKREITELSPAGFNLCVQAFMVPVSSCNDSETFRNFSPKASLVYASDSGLTAYISYGKGYKSGGFNPLGSRSALIAAGAPLGIPESAIYVQDQYEEEVSESYEVGLKGRLFDDRLSINASIFYTEVEGAQQFEFFPTAGLQTVTSIDKVELKGFDVDFRALLPGNIDLFGGVGVTDGEVEEFAANPLFEGNDSPGSTAYTALLGLTSTIELNNGLTLTPRIEYNKSGPIWWDFANTAGTERDPVELIDARLSLAQDDKWELSLWGKNLTDEDFYQEVVPLLGVLSVNYRAPTRSYGVDLTYTF